MAMSVVNVVHVRMGVANGLVSVPVGVRHLRELLRRVCVLMVGVMRVLVRMLEGDMLVEVLVRVSRNQERAGRHRGQGQYAPSAQKLAQDDPGKNRGEARREREQYAGLQNTKLPESAHEERDRESE